MPKSVKRPFSELRCATTLVSCAHFMRNGVCVHRMQALYLFPPPLKPRQITGGNTMKNADGPAELYIRKEYHAVILAAIDALTPDERHLWDDLLSEKTKAKIAEECGLSEGAIRKRVKKLAATLRENPGLKNYF
jgi:DNA-directed RNA polymerase specialized sigma24 family protein